jgi:putative spermidine/putrescine transport system ATP-binding protein
MTGVRLDDVSFGYGSTPVVRGISFSVEPSQLVTLLGRSGCGKTTILKLIGGYLTPSSGRIAIRGRDVTDLPPEARNAGMVFQNYALFPHLTARDNVGFGLDVRRVPRTERDRRVEAMLDRVGLSAEERDRMPSALSGGQQQRVALARALIIEPDVLLLDEPFANLDRHLRDSLRGELRALQRAAGVATIFVTHDQEEALAISDRIGVMSAGRILQFGAPEEVYNRPQSPIVARFLGAANLVDGKLLGRDAALVMIRPENCRLDPEPSERIAWPSRVVSVTFLGTDRLVGVACDNGVTLRVRTRARVEVGERTTVGFAEDQIWPIPQGDDL